MCSVCPPSGGTRPSASVGTSVYHRIEEQDAEWRRQRRILCGSLSFVGSRTLHGRPIVAPRCDGMRRRRASAAVMRSRSPVAPSRPIPGRRSLWACERSTVSEGRGVVCCTGGGRTLGKSELVSYCLTAVQKQYRSTKAQPRKAKRQRTPHWAKWGLRHMGWCGRRPARLPRLRGAAPKRRTAGVRDARPSAAPERRGSAFHTPAPERRGSTTPQRHASDQGSK